MRTEILPDDRSSADYRGLRKAFRVHTPHLELAAQRFEAFERAFLVRPHRPRILRDIGGEDRSETAGLAHVGSPAAKRRPER
jgi:hypothetical protein